MSTTQFIIILSLSGVAILLWASSVWGGWAEKFYERYKDSGRVWQVLRLAGVNLSKNNCVRFVRAVSFVGIVLAAIGIFAATSEFLQNGEAEIALFGKWAQSRPDGSTMVWEFTATKMGFTLIDASGNQAEPQNRTGVSYTKLGRSVLGDRYRIEFTSTTGELTNTTGELEGDVTVVVRDRDTLLLDFLGRGPYKLVRMQP